MNIGICNWSSLYQFTHSDLLSEGFKTISDKFKHFTTLKIYLGKRSSKTYRFKDVDTTKMKLVDIAKLPEYTAIFSAYRSPFSTIIIVCHSTHREKSNYWNTECTDEDMKNEEDEFADLANYLRTFTDKTFILQNWESDNYKNKTELATKNMIRWIKHRQEGIDRFRKNPSNNGTYDNVFHAIEVNHIFSENTVIHDVIPHVRIDLVSYSCYDTQQNSLQFEKAIQFILSSIHRERNYCKGVPKCLNRFPVPLYIGEFGVSHKHRRSFEVTNILYQVIKISRHYKLPYVNFWNLYNNEPENNFGLIDCYGKNTVSGNWFINHFYDDMMI